jgi:hypothetical protein
METYDAPETPAPRKTNPGLVWNILTIVVLVAVVLLVVVFGLIFANPYLPLNPFPPEQVPALLDLPTATPTLKQMPATCFASI